MATIDGSRSRTETSLLQNVWKIVRLQIGIFEIHGPLRKYVKSSEFSFASTLTWNLSKGEGLTTTDLQECIRPLYLNKPCFLYYGSRIGCRTFGKEKRILIWLWKSHVFHQPGKKQEMMFHQYHIYLHWKNSNNSLYMITYTCFRFLSHESSAYLLCRSSLLWQHKMSHSHNQLLCKHRSIKKFITTTNVFFVN